MLKKNPFLFASLIFGGVAVVVFLISALSFLNNDTTIIDTICKLFHLSSTKFNNGTLSEIACILALPAFLFALKGLTDTETES